MSKTKEKPFQILVFRHSDLFRASDFEFRILTQNEFEFCITIPSKEFFLPRTPLPGSWPDQMDPRSSKQRRPICLSREYRADQRSRRFGRYGAKSTQWPVVVIDRPA